MMWRSAAVVTFVFGGGAIGIAQVPQVAAAHRLLTPRDGFERFEHRWGGISGSGRRTIATFEYLNGDWLPDSFGGDVAFNLGLMEYGRRQPLFPPFSTSCQLLLHEAEPSFADVDADGDRDVVWFAARVEPTCGQTSGFLFLNDGNGSLREAAGAFGMTPAGLGGTAVADFDLDGDLDVAAAGIGQYGNIPATPDAYFENVGNLTFVHRPNRIPAIPDRTYQLIAADVDADGDQDLVKLCAGFNPAPPSRVFLNRGDGHFVHAQDLPTVWGIPAFLCGDVNADGCDDLLQGDRFSSAPARLYMGSFNGQLVDETWRLPPSSGAAHGAMPVLEDLDGDGDLDIAVGERWTQTGPHRALRYWRNDGSGRFSDVTDSLMPVLGDELPVWLHHHSYDIHGAGAADQDGDGDVDLLVVPGSGPYRPAVGGYTLWNLQRHLETSGNPQVGQQDYAVTVFADRGDVVIPVLSFGRSLTKLGSLGVLQIDPVLGVAGLPLRTGSDRTATLPMPIPADPGLTGAALHWQGIHIQMPSGAVHLTNGVRDVIR